LNVERLRGGEGRKWRIGHRLCDEKEGTIIKRKFSKGRERGSFPFDLMEKKKPLARKKGRREVSVLAGKRKNDVVTEKRGGTVANARRWREKRNC